MSLKTTKKASPLSKLTFCKTSPSILMCMLVVLVTTLISSMSHAATSERSFSVNVVGSGEAIILIPGLMSSGNVYDTLASELSQRYELHVLSVKGFAGTPQTGKFSLVKLASDLTTYINNENLNKPTIIGHSMGGLTAFVMASEHPSIIGKVISIDGLPFIGPVFTRTNATTAQMLEPQAHNMKAMFENMSQAQVAAQTQQSIFIQATSPAHQALIVDMAQTSDPSTVGAAMFDVMTTDLRESLKSSTTPILMLGASGAFTQQTQHEQVKALYEAQFENVANATVTMNTKVRHFMMLDDVVWLNQQISQFLEANE